MEWMPGKFMRLPDRLGCEFGYRDVEENVGTRRLQGHKLGFDRGIGRLVSEFLDDQFVGFLAQSLLEPGDEVFSKIVVLAQDRDLRIGDGSKDVTRELLSLFT